MPAGPESYIPHNEAHEQHEAEHESPASARERSCKQGFEQLAALPAETLEAILDKVGSAIPKRSPVCIAEEQAIRETHNNNPEEIPVTALLSPDIALACLDMDNEQQS